MKKWTPWIAGVIVLILLVIRLAYLHVDKLGREKAWYISELHYQCSAQIDSIIRPGRALLRVTNGHLDEDREWQLKEQLHAHGVLHLAISRGLWYDLRVPNEALPGDSVYINSEYDQLSIYRKGKLLITRPLSSSLRGRPF